MQPGIYVFYNIVGCGFFRPLHSATRRYCYNTLFYVEMRRNPVFTIQSDLTDVSRFGLKRLLNALMVIVIRENVHCQRMLLATGLPLVKC